jgi:ATP-dependent DNA helicase Rep
VSGGTSFFDRAEIKDLCAWFRLWVNNDDDPAFLRAITTPKRGIGHTTLARWAPLPAVQAEPVRGAVLALLPAALPPSALGSLHEFGRYMNDLEYRARHTTGAEAPAPS